MAKSLRSTLGVSLEEWLHLFPVSHQREYKYGSYILRENTTADSCLLILKGKVEITKKVRGARNLRVAVIKPGDFFGEMGMLSGLKRTASARAMTEVKVLVMTRQDFYNLIEKDQVLGAKLALLFARELAVRCHQVLQLLAKSNSDSDTKRKKQVNFSSVLNSVYELLAV